MNMMQEIWQTTRLALSFKACRRELDAIEQRYPPTASLPATPATVTERTPEATGKSQQPFAKQRDSRPAGGRTGWLHIIK